MWEKELAEKQEQLKDVKAQLSQLRKLERELKKDIEGINNMMIMEKHWAENKK